MGINAIRAYKFVPEIETIEIEYSQWQVEKKQLSHKSSIFSESEVNLDGDGSESAKAFIRIINLFTSIEYFWVVAI